MADCHMTTLRHRLRTTFKGNLGCHLALQRNTSRQISLSRPARYVTSASKPDTLREAPLPDLCGRTAASPARTHTDTLVHERPSPSHPSNAVDTFHSCRLGHASASGAPRHATSFSPNGASSSHGAAPSLWPSPSSPALPRLAARLLPGLATGCLALATPPAALAATPILPGAAPATPELASAAAAAGGVLPACTDMPSVAAASVAGGSWLPVLPDLASLPVLASSGGGLLPVLPDLSALPELESLPLWAPLLGLLAANVAGLALTIAVLRGLQDASEELTVVKLQVAMLERRPQLQSKLSELSSMIQVGQQGAWLILEEAILQLLQHQGTIAYGSVSATRLRSKKRAYAVFGSMAEAEAAKARREESVVRHIGETISDSEEDDGSSAGGAGSRTVGGGPRGKASARSGRSEGGGGGGKGLFGGLVGGLSRGLGLGSPARPTKELMVVTLIVAARGKLKIDDQVTDWPGLRHALQQVTGLSSDRVMAVELLWTPRSESDYLTREQLEADYPELLPLQGGPAAEQRSY